MAGGKLSPRQKMINMMYLVLIALLALNVSKEIIKAFNLIENSLDQSTKGATEKNGLMMRAIAKEAEKNERAKAAQNYAKEVQGICSNFQSQLDAIKTDLEAIAGGRKSTDDGGELVKGGKNELTEGDATDKHANYFLLDNNATKGKHTYKFVLKSKNRGEQVKELINNTRKQFLAVIQKAMNDPLLGKKDNITLTLLKGKFDELNKNSSFSAESAKNTDGKEQDWVSMYLEHSPLAGVFALLSKYTNDAKNIEGEIIAKLAESVSASDVKFDKFIPVMQTKSSAVLEGQPFEAEFLMAAYNSQSNMVVNVNGASMPVVDGKAKFTGRGAMGENNLKVSISIPKPGGETEVQTADFSYLVMKPNASFSADQLNVFYVGLENPVTIGVSGVDANGVNASATGPCTLVKVGPGKYQARCAAGSAGQKVTLSASATVQGRVMPMGSKEFRIKQVPRPYFMAGAVAFNAPVSLAAISVQSNAVAKLDGFVYEGVSFRITGYRFTCIGRRTSGPKVVNVNSNSLAPIKSFLGMLGSNDIIAFENITAVGPDGATKYLDNVSATVR